MEQYSEVFVGLDVAKARHAVVVAFLGKSRLWQPDWVMEKNWAMEKMASTTSRNRVCRLRPHPAGGGKCGSITAHASSVVSLA